MKRLSLVFACAAVLVLGTGVTLRAQNSPPTSSGTWSGVIVGSTCSATDAFNEVASCTAKGAAKVSLYDDTQRKVYDLDPQNQAAGREGDSVVVTGVLDGNTIRVNSLDAPAIGLAVGQKAPDFKVRDQFGREQTLETLRGPKGTLLLFFRSADW